MVKDSPDTPCAENSDISIAAVCQTHDASNPCTCGTAPRYSFSVSFIDLRIGYHVGKLIQVIIYT